MATIDKNYITWDDVRSSKKLSTNTKNLKRLLLTFLILVILCIGIMYFFEENEDRLEVKNVSNLIEEEQIMIHPKKQTNLQTTSFCKKIELMKRDVGLQGKIRIGENVKRKCPNLVF